MPPTDRPTLFRDPRAAYLTLVEILEQQLGKELSSQQQERKESRIFRKNMFVREVLSTLEGEIRVDHGRLQPTNPELLKSVFEPLKSAVQILQDFASAPLPFPTDQKLEFLNLGDQDIITSAMVEADLRVRAHDDSEMALDRLIESILNPAKVEFGKYALHCHGIATSVQAQSLAASTGADNLIADDFADLLASANKADLIGVQAKVVQSIAKNGGRISIPDADALCDGDAVSAYKNAKPKLRKLGWFLRQHDNCLIAERIPKVQK